MTTHAVGQHHRVQRIVGDQHRRAVEVREVAAQRRRGLEPGARVQGGQRLVQQQQRRVRRPAPGRARPAAPARRTAARAGAGACSARPTRSSQPRPRCRAARRPTPRAARPERDVLQRASGAGTAGSPGTPCRSGASAAGCRRRASRSRRPAGCARRSSGTQPGQRAQRGGLARAVRAEQRRRTSPGGRPPAPTSSRNDAAGSRRPRVEPAAGSSCALTACIHRSRSSRQHRRPTPPAAPG